MSREDLLNKNAQILKDIAENIKKISPKSIVMVVTNPLDLMTRLVLKITGFPPNRVFGMGITLDAARFSNLISKELNIPNTDIEACVIGVHGEGMLALSRLTHIKGVALDEFLPEPKIKDLVRKTTERGAQIVSLLGSGSAYFAPSQAIATIVKTIIKDEKRTLGVSACLDGEYGIKDICIGVPCRLGKQGIEQIIELDLNKQEKEILFKSAASLKEQYQNIKI
jgi:malate dehydrogenase